MSKRKRFCMIVVLVAGLLVPSLALASGFKWIGFDAGAIATGNGQVALGSSVGVASTNPALMSRIAPYAGIDFIFYVPQLSINLMDRPANADVPFVMYDTQLDEATTSRDRPLPTVELKNKRADTNVDDPQYFLALGGMMDMGVKGLRIGGNIVLPLPEQVNMTTWYSHEQEQYFSNKVHFQLFGEWSPIVTGILAASYAHPEWDFISVGVGIQLSVSATATMGIYMPSIQANDYAKGNVDMDMSLFLRPIIGIQAQPLDWLSIGLTWKLWNRMKVDGAGDMLLWNFRTPPGEDNGSEGWVPKRVHQDGHNYIIDYEPMEMSLGVGFTYEKLQAQVSATWNHWSDYKDHHATRPQDAAEYQDVVEVDTEGVYEPPVVDGSKYKWSETISANINLAYSYFDWATVKGGFTYSPSPVPTQDGRTNYADSDVWCLALGHRFDFAIKEHNFHAELGFQFWYMLQRTVYKDSTQIIDEFPDSAKHIFELVPVAAAEGLQTNNPGYPGYTQKGWLTVGSVNLSYEF